MFMVNHMPLLKWLKRSCTAVLLVGDQGMADGQGKLCMFLEKTFHRNTSLFSFNTDLCCGFLEDSGDFSLAENNQLCMLFQNNDHTTEIERLHACNNSILVSAKMCEQ